MGLYPYSNIVTLYVEGGLFSVSVVMSFLTSVIEGGVPSPEEKGVFKPHKTERYLRETRKSNKKVLLSNIALNTKRTKLKSHLS